MCSFRQGACCYHPPKVPGWRWRPCRHRHHRRRRLCTRHFPVLQTLFQSCPTMSRHPVCAGTPCGALRNVFRFFPLVAHSVASSSVPLRWSAFAKGCWFHSLDALFRSPNQQPDPSLGFFPPRGQGKRVSRPGCRVVCKTITLRSSAPP